MLTAKGLRVYTRPNGRIFPVDRTRMFAGYCISICLMSEWRLTYQRGFGY
ncbi:MAG: hypothetical protein R2688_04710 [Fimbriimonadaceae bacterium]